MRKIVLFLLLLLLVRNTYSLDTNIVKYYPLRVGNFWTYYYESSNIPYYRYRYRVTVLDTLIKNAQLYYKVLTNRPYHGELTETLRVNSQNGNILKYSQQSYCLWLQNEILIDSLASRLHDSAKAGCTLFFKCSDTSYQTIFGIMKPQKKFTYEAFENYQSRKYIKDFGRTFIDSWGGVGGSFSVLIGCRINGIVYGDTSLVGLNNISSEIPDDFSLYQNYPNPFNPVTKIQFSLPLPSQGGVHAVRLVIYDVLGREVATLINEQLKPGTYEVEFNGTNYPSGIYFYKLTIADASALLSITKKMVLVK